MQVFNNNQVCRSYVTCSYINFILKENSYIIQFLSKLNQFESLNMSIVPQIENPTHQLYIGNSKKEININDIFIKDKIKCDLCEYTASKSTFLKHLVTIKHWISVQSFKIPIKFDVNYVIQFAYPKLHYKKTEKL